MSQQQVLFSTPVSVFEAVDGVTTEKGTGACSIVGQPGNPPRYKLVCFDEERNVLCTATIGETNQHSLRFQLQTIEYACFHDDDEVLCSILFLRTGDVDTFLAHLGSAFFGASRQPTHSTVIADFAHTSKLGGGPGSEVLELGRRAKVRFTAFGIQPGETSNDLPLLTSNEPMETNGDLPYAFEAVQSAFTIPTDGKGFESSALGMITDCTRIVVVPATMPRNSKASDTTIAFVIHLKRVVADPTADVTGAVAEARSASRHESRVTAASTALAITGSTRPRTDAGPPKPAHRDPSAPGSGIPAEHMLLVQKVATQVNTALSGLRDLQDKVENFNGEWKQAVTRPKPSVLPNNALEQNLRNLINDNERAREELERREELMRALEERNRDLQKRVDKAAQLAQTLMEEKKKTVSQTSDMRLEMDRQNLRLQEQVTQATNERDDIQRHLDTVKKLLNMSDDALKDTKGKFDIVQVQVRGTGDKLDAAEDQLAEERTRRKALEAKVAAQHEELRNGMAEVTLKSAELDDVNRKADADRVYHAQLMEDERERRSVEVAQLRSEIVTELQNREEKNKADRARVSNDNFERGHEEGLEIGRRNARIDIDHRMQELQLEAQRTKTELDAYKTQLRDARDDALAENRRLEAAVAALKQSVEESTKQKARNEYLMHSLRLRVKHAEDALLLGLTSTAHRLTRVIEPVDLLAVLDDLHSGNPHPALAFEGARLDSEASDAYTRREGWMLDEAVSVYEGVITKTFEDTVQPFHAAFADLNADIARLWFERDMGDLEEVMAGEANVRNGTESEEASEFAAIEQMLADEISAQKAIIAEEEDLRPPIAAEYDDFAADLAAFIVEQACARQNVVLEQEGDFAAIEREEDELFHEMWTAFERVVFEKAIAEQEEVMGEEEQARIAVEEEEATADGELRAAAAEEASVIRDLVAEREKEMRAAREVVEGDESRGRVELEMDEDTDFGAMEQQFKDEMPKPPTPPPTPTPPREATPTPPREPTPEPSASASDEEPVTAPPSGPSGGAQTKVPPPMPPAKGLRTVPPPKDDLPAFRVADDSDSEVGSAPAAPLPMPKPKAKSVIPTNRAISNPLGDDDVGTGKAAVAVSDSESDDGGILSQKRQAPPPKPAAKKAPSAAGNAQLFGSDSEDGDAPLPAPRPAAGKRPAPKTSAGLFGSDSDDTDATPRAPAAKPAKKKVMPRRPAGGGGMFGSDTGSADVTPRPKQPPARKPAAKAAGLFDDDSD